MSDFPEPTQWNGDDTRELGRSTGEPEPWKCLICPAGGKGWVKRSRHWYATGHRIVWGKDPRAKCAPHASADPQPEEQTMVGDGQGRR